MRKYGRVLAAGIMLAALLCGCAGKTENTAELSPAPGVSPGLEQGPVGQEYLGASSSSGTKNNSTAGKGQTPSPGTNQGTGEKIFSNAAYVLIYNPLLYQPNLSEQENAKTDMNTGYLGTQIVAGTKRTDALTPEGEASGYPRSYDEIPVWDDSMAEYQGIRGSGLDPVYKAGDKHEFVYGLGEGRKKGKFTCLYAGTHCYVWTINQSISKEEARIQGKNFDEEVYGEVVAAYGTPRFTENGGKVNLLYYSMEEINYGGFFTTYDIFYENEYKQSWGEKEKYNFGHAILNICSHCGSDYNKSTAAHEFQHLICASNTFGVNRRNWMDSWLNESMSLAAEELIRSGIADSYQKGKSFYESDRYRNGQSIYNFGVEYGKDEGAYGAVYLLSEYLKQKGGASVFSKVHSFWRTTPNWRDATEEAALYQAIPEKERTSLQNKYVYSSQVEAKLGGEKQVLLSKLMLDFWISTIENSPIRCDIYAEKVTYNGKKLSATEWKNVFRQMKLYQQVNGAQIEGGGCVLVATKNGSFSAPKDADTNLIYVAFDKDFKVIGTSLSSSKPTPTKAPTKKPTPTKAPTKKPTPTKAPTKKPTPTKAPTKKPTPTKAPTKKPTPTKAPTKKPTPTKAPTKNPTPTKAPTKKPTPTKAPTKKLTPTKAPTKKLTPTPTAVPVFDGTFVWNRGRNILRIDQEAATKNTRDTMMQAIIEELKTGATAEVYYADVNSLKDRMSEVRKAMDGDYAQVGLLLIELSGKEERGELEKLLEQAHQRGILVFTYGDFSMEAEDITWAVHFDYSNIDTQFAFHFWNHSEVDAEELGKGIAYYLDKVRSGSNEHWSLYYKK